MEKFKNRVVAGIDLAGLLQKELGDLRPDIILGIPTAGLFVAAPVIDHYAEKAIRDIFPKVNKIISRGWNEGSESIRDHYEDFSDVPESEAVAIIRER